MTRQQQRARRRTMGRAVPVDEVTPAAVRSWHAKAGRTTGPTALAQSDRLLHPALNAAVADEAIPSNPC